MRFFLYHSGLAGKMGKRTFASPNNSSTIHTTEWRPVPDPTVLTTQQLQLAISSQRDLFETRLDAMDKAIILLQEMANRSPTVGEVYVQFGTKIDNIEKRLDHKYVETATDITHLRDLQSERMSGLEKKIDNQFLERDKRTDQLTLASSTAIAAALQAQKEAAGEAQKSSSAAVSKAETATSDSIRQLQTLFQTSIGAMNTQILDVKSRLDKGEGGQSGQRETILDHRWSKRDERETSADNRGAILGVIGMVVGMAALVITIIGHLH
jgi:hypothetical protein